MQLSPLLRSETSWECVSSIQAWCYLRWAISVVPLPPGGEHTDSNQPETEPETEPKRNSMYLVYTSDQGDGGEYSGTVCHY